MNARQPAGVNRGASIPRATYRLQFNRDFTFRHALHIVPYLAQLGISHLYASPILKARPGSTHGYDVVDHTQLNPELGSRAEFDELVNALHAHGMGLLVDIVPNHLGIMGADNAWWLDVLENGPAAAAASCFDIDWRPNRGSLRNRVLVPVLGEPYGAVLEQGQLQVEFIAEQGAFNVRYHEHCFPVDPREYPRIFANHSSALPLEDPDRADFESLLRSFAQLPARDVDDAEARAMRYRDKEVHKRRLVRLIERSAQILLQIEAAVARLNGVPGEPSSFDALDALLDAQAYRLAYWRVAGDEINYRRFFDVNDLAALRMNEPHVFERTHELIFSLIDAGKIDGLRIDHSDGLFDPQTYFEWVQRRCGARAGADERPLYMVTEKILAMHERLPTHWAVHGTTGYDFVALVSGWLASAAHEDTMTRLYRQYSGVQESFEQLAYQSRILVMRTSLAAEIEVLATQLDRIAQLDRRTADFTRNAMREAIVEVIACFPVYRTYVSESGASDEDRRIVQWAVNVARRRSAAAELTVFDFLRDVLLGDMTSSSSRAQSAMLEFAMKFQQVTAPVTAKGVEDTAFYRYNRLLCVNEVGSDPRRFAFSNSAVHQENLERARAWPASLLATSTHDTKRSEDARARIAVLSELPELWRHHLMRWTRLNRSRRALIDNAPAPSRNDEYFIYQSLLGVWSPEADAANLVERLQAYVVKSAREAKRSTSWMNPDAQYEQALQDFVARLLEKPEQNAFLRDFSAFATVIAGFGELNSLAQTALKLTAPGVPDFYQGTEVLNFSLVDPDNRRPVDFAALAAQLAKLQRMPGDRAGRGAALTLMRSDAAKHFLIWELLQLRQRLPELFASGQYEPLALSGKHREHALAFARRHGERALIVIIPSAIATLMHGEVRAPLGEIWEDTAVTLPENLAGVELDDVLGRQRLVAQQSGEGEAPMLLLAQALSVFPVAVMTSRH